VKRDENKASLFALEFNVQTAENRYAVSSTQANLQRCYRWHYKLYQRRPFFKQSPAHNAD